MKIFLNALLFCAIAVSLRAQTLGTSHIFPSNNPWNQRVDSLPVHWNSDKYIASVGGTIHVHPDFGSNALYGIPWAAVSSTQPMVPIIFDQNSYTDQSDPGPMPIPLNARIEGGGNDGGDDHVLVVDTSNQHLYELYQGSRSGSGWRATSSAVFALDSNNYRPDGWTSCDAAGLPIFPGLVRLDECKAGAINHALRFTVPHTQKGWIFPARHEAGSTSDTTYMPMGLRLRLKAKFDDSKDTGYAKVIITALKKYGIILADNGSSWYISGETNTNWPDDDLNQLKAITGNDFEAVYTGPVRTQPNEYPDPVLPIPSNGGVQVPSIARDTARVGDANAVIIPVVNNGSSALTISRYWLKYGSVFQIADSATHSIAAGGSAKIDVDFLPIIHGEAVDTLFIASNDPATPTTATALAGMGTEGVFHLSANPLDFGSVTIGNADTMVIVLTNPGDGELDVNATSSTGTSPDFTIIGIGPQASPPFVLMPGDTEFALVQFTPSTVGPDTSLFALTFSDTSGEEYDTVLIAVGEGLSLASVTSPAQPGPFALSIFPNPTAGSMQISTSGFGGRANLIILNSLGQTVWAGWTDAATKNVDLSLLPNGSYFVHATGPNGSAAQRIVLEH